MLIRGPAPRFRGMSGVRLGQQKCEAIVEWILQSEIYVGPHAALQAIDRIFSRNASYALRSRHERSEAFLCQTIEDFRFVLEMLVSGCRGIADSLGKGAHRKAF